jgi:gamma-glutamyl:cysteine ligase YbdK (ATP-grasp superfamily)
VFVDPKTFKKLSMRKAIENLFILVEPAAVSLGLKKHFNTLEEIFYTGTGSEKQRKIYARSNNFKHMLKTLKEQFYIR